MATDFTKEVESSISDVKNFGKTLTDISKKYQKSLDEIGKKSKEIPKSWSEITQKLKESITPTGLLSKNISDISKKMEAGKVKQASLTSEIQKNAEKRRTIESTINKIGEQSNKIINGAAISGRKLTVDEKDRLKVLSDNESKLRISSDQLLTQQKILGRQVRSEKEKNNKLQAQINTLRIISAIYDSTKDAIIGLIKLGERYDKVLQKIANDVGIGRIEAEKFVPALSASASKSIALGATLADAGLAAKELVDQFELVANMALEDVNHQMLVLNKAFGVALGDSAKFYASLTQIGNVSLESQTNMTGVADAAAKAAGVPLARVIKDVAAITTGVRLLFKGNTAELIKQVAEARKLGTTLDSAAKSAEALLDFESSVGNELKASALLGKNVNFNESRRLFFSGKMLEGEKALIRELENVGDLNELNYFQRKAIAQLTGKDFSELQKIQAQKKQQLSLDSKFPELAKERREEEEKLNKIMGSTEAQRERALEMEARDNIANARANVLAAQKEQILVNISRIIQPLYRLFTQLAETVLKWGVNLTEVVANWSKTEPLWTSIGVAVLGIGVAFGAVRLAMVLWTRGLTPLGTSINRFLVTVGTGLASLAATGSSAILIILTIAAALAAIGVAGWGLGKLFSGIGDLIRSILDPIVKLIEVVVSGFNTFISNIGSAMINVVAGLKSITDIGFFGLSKAAAGVAMMTQSIIGLGIALATFPTDKLSGFASDFATIANTSVASLNKISEIFETASASGGKIMIGIEEEAVVAINKLADLKNERDELKQTIKDGNDRLVKEIENLASMMANGGIAVNLDGQLVSRQLSTTAYRSGGFGQSTTRS
jgi:protein-disulfide isomerase-like protein with CxxC motif